MIKKIFSLLFVIIVLILSYKRFQNYSPNLISKFQAVKGASTQKEKLPYPSGSEVVSSSFSEKTENYTVKSSLDYQKINEFYKNILLESKWVLKTEQTNDTYSNMKFKKNKTEIEIVCSIGKNDGYTLYSVSISQD